ncbi:hypothetical protein B0H63DRAFT_267180 [Podospora didyma]|uniref:Eukaryotic translation initiation factor 6 n=1 Tax=Podospora didyma TaxID=330526 RepID=A0AAE0KF70_9PEZI|nr:hypothetical protein B0H63DRAFT_267180 [Podospora didyma]
MSGNPPEPSSRDPSPYPDASELIWSILDDRPTSSTVSPSGELYRAIERYQRTRRRLRNLDAETNMSSSSDRALRRRFNRDPPTSIEALLPGTTGTSAAQNPSSLPPLRVGARQRSVMASSGGLGSTRSTRSRPSIIQERSRASDREDRGTPHPTFEEMNRDLDSTNARLRALLDASDTSRMPPRAPPQASPPLHTYDQAEDSRRIKRRKVDSNKPPAGFKGFEYGQKGQVEPGQLVMEIASCDGGLFSDEPTYAVENILKDDKKVYCTKGNRCNIVLQHQGATVFSLKELVIKAPSDGYSSPVREGMVFVSMASDELLTRTARYQIQYLPSPNPRSMTTTYSVLHDEDGNVTRSQAIQRRGFNLIDDEDDLYTAQIPTEFTVAPPPFNITTECNADDESEGEAGRYMRSHTRRTPNRIGALPFESDSSDEGEHAWGPAAGSEWARFDHPSRIQFYRRVHDDNGEAGSMTLAEAQEAAQIATQEAVRAVGGALMAPLAHFHIEKNKNKCTIRFDPPVSGRYILLKMWNPHHNPAKNIDIQSVIAKGFAGPRYFPAVDFQ